MHTARMHTRYAHAPDDISAVFISNEDYIVELWRPEPKLSLPVDDRGERSTDQEGSAGVALQMRGEALATVGVEEGSEWCMRKRAMPGREDGSAAESSSRVSLVTRERDKGERRREETASKIGRRRVLSSCFSSRSDSTAESAAESGIMSGRIVMRSSCIDFEQTERTERAVVVRLGES